MQIYFIYTHTLFLLAFYSCFVKYCIDLKSAYANIIYLHKYFIFIFIDLLYLINIYIYIYIQIYWFKSIYVIFSFKGPFIDYELLKLIKYWSFYHFQDLKKEQSKKMQKMCD